MSLTKKHTFASTALAAALVLSSTAVMAEEASTEVGADEGDAMGTASGTKSSGFELGARIGYGLPLGEVAEDGDLDEAIASQVPIWIDAGYRINESLFVGGYFAYGFGQLSDEIDDLCVDGVDCSLSVMRFGVQGVYNILPSTESTSPWVGLGIGYEIYGLSVEAAGESADLSASGFEFANLQGGVDFEVANAMRVGPFLSFSLGQYSSVEADGDSQDIENKALHQWLTLGVRGTFGPLG